MTQVTVVPESNKNVTIGNEALNTDTLTFDTIEGIFDDHTDAFNSPRKGINNEDNKNVTVVNDPF